MMSWKLGTLLTVVGLMASTAVAQPANDSCFTGTPISGPGVYDFTTVGSTTDTPAQCPLSSRGTPLGQTDVWFSYTAGRTGVAEIRVPANPPTALFGVGISVWTGCGGSVIACAGSARTTPVRFPITQGQVYKLRVATHTNLDGSFQTGAGTFTLNEYNAPVTNSTCAAPYSVMGPGSYLWDASAASANPPFSSCGTADSATQKAVWFSYTAAQTGTATFTAAETNSNTNRDTTIALFSGCNAANQIACASSVVGEPWWVSLNVTAGQQYLVRVARQSSTTWKLLNIAEYPAPVGDACASAIALSVGPNNWSNVGVIDGGLYETPLSCADGARAFQWFVFNPPSNGTATFTANAGGADTVLEAFTSCGGASLGCNDNTGVDGNNEIGSYLALKVQQSVPVYVRMAQALGGGNNDFYRSGTIQVTLQPSLANDECANAAVITTGSYTYNNRTATGSAQAAPSCSLDASKDLWYSWTPTQDGLAVIHTCDGTEPNPNGKSELSVYQGCGGNEIACNVDRPNLPAYADMPGFGYPCVLGNIVQFFAHANTTYIIRIGTYQLGYQDLSGTGKLTVQFVPTSASTALEAWPFGGDVGDVPASASTPAGSGALNAIYGFQTSDQDIDLYKIRICDPENFSATTINSFTSFNTALSLYNASGVGVAFNDDDVAELGDVLLRSTLTSQFISGGPADYYLAVSRGGETRLPVSNDGAIWFRDPVGVEREPDAEGASGALIGWTGQSFPGDYLYRVDLTGVCFAQQVVVCPADFNGDHVRDVADLFGYINAWLAKTPNANFNHDSAVDVADLFGFINAWLAGC